MVDIIGTRCFSVFVLWATVAMVRSSVVRLMENTPSKIDVRQIKSGLGSFLVCLVFMIFMFGPYLLTKRYTLIM